nr:hypothetical protein [Tanacetum cinerariifolium]
MSGPYVKRMIPEPGNPNREVPLNETFHEQTDDELTENELKQVEIDDQAIQTILLGLPEEIYVVVDSCETTQEIWLRVQQMMKGFDIGIQEKKRISSNPRNRQFAQPGMNMGQDRQMQMAGGNGGNSFRQYARQNAEKHNGYNGVQNVKNYIVQNAVQNPRVQIVRNQNGLIVVSRIANQNPNGNGNVVAARVEGNAIGNNGDLDQIDKVNANCFLMANLQQASTSGTQTDNAPVYDSDGSTEVHHYENCYNNDIFNMFTQEEQYTEILEPIPEPHQVQQNDSNVISEVSSVEQSRRTIDQHPATVEKTHAYFELLYNNLAIEVERVYSVNRKMKEINAYLTTELARYKNQEKCFEISQEKYDKLERVQNFEIQFLKEAAKFVRDFQSLAKEADESLAKHKALELEIERLLRTIISQDIMSIVQNPSVVDTSNLQTELERVDNTAKTRRPQPKSNTKNDRVPSASKSSCIKNNDIQVEKYHRNLLLSKNKKHMSSEAARKMLIFSRAPLFLWAKAIATTCYTQNHFIVHFRFNKTPYELINGRKPDISFLHVFGALCYHENDPGDIGKLIAKGEIGFFIGYSADSCAYTVYNRRTKKIMETMNVTFDELSAMAFEQNSSKPGLQSMTSEQISSGLDLTYAPSIITSQQPTECELDLLFEAMYDDYIGGQPLAATRTALATQAPQVLQTPTTTTTTADTTPTPTNSSS